MKGCSARPSDGSLARPGVFTGLLLALVAGSIPAGPARANDVFLTLPEGGRRGPLRRQAVRQVAGGEAAAVPAVAVLPDGRVAVVVAVAEGWRERLQLQLAADVSSPLGPPRVVARGARACQPRLAVSPRGELWLAWCGRHDEPAPGDHSLQVYLRRLLPAPSGPAVTVSTGGRACHPALAIGPDGDIHLAWEQWSAAEPARVRIGYRRLGADGKPRAAVAVLSAGSFARRPALAAAGGRVWLAWDELVATCPTGTADPDYDVLWRSFQDGHWSEPRVAAGGPGIQAAPALLADGQQLLLAWHDSRPRGLVKWWRLRRWQAGKWQEPVAGNPALESDRRGEQQGGEFPVLARLAGGAILVASRSSQGAQLQLIDSRGISPVLDLTRRGWGSRCRQQSLVLGPDGSLLLGRRGRHGPVLERLLVTPAAGPVRWKPVRPERTQEQHCLQPGRLAGRDFPGWGQRGQVLFGDIHMHSAVSDGSGAPDEILARAWNRGLDFAALTDHDHIVGRPLFPSQWNELAWLADVFDSGPHFAVLPAFEWTTPPVPAGSGHRNVYFAGPAPPRICGFHWGCDDIRALTEWLRPYRALAIPHHTSWTGVEWAADDRGKLFEIVSVHGVSEYPDNHPLPPRSPAQGARPAFAATELAQGRLFGFVGGSDGHGLLWHHGQGRRRNPWLTGLTGVVAEVPTRQAIFDALWARRTFATSGARLAAGLEANGTGVGQMGRGRGPVKLVYRVQGKRYLGLVEIIRDGRTVFHLEVEGKRQIGGSYVDEPGPGRHYYYLRARQAGQPPELIWTSPLFFDIGAEK